MRRSLIAGSLRWRLLVAGACAIAAALALAAFGLSVLFDRHIERAAVAELRSRSLALAALIEPREAGAPVVRGELRDPVYARPFSGTYWQIDTGERLWRSRSLWDHALELPAPPPPLGGSRTLTLPGPLGADLLVLERTIGIGPGADGADVRLVLAMSRSRLDAARRAFVGDLIPYTALLGLFLIAASAVQVAIGLRPLGAIGARVAALSSGRARRIGSDLPTEVAPLAARIDALLARRETELVRARTRAGDLAHGLKTPLQALEGDAARLRGLGHRDLAASIELIAGAMRRHVERELARARIQSGQGRDRAEVPEIARRLVEVLRRTPDGANVAWSVTGEGAPAAAIDPADLTEALGALMENAMRHARSEVRVGVSREGAHVTIEVVDDGPGVPEARLGELVRRGVRLDEAGGGEGIGLAIVDDIADAAGGAVVFETGAPGLRVRLSLPVAAAPE